MLLHNTKINVGIANILHYQKSLYGHQGLRNINSLSLKNPRWAWPIFKGSHYEFGLILFSQLLSTIGRSIWYKSIDSIFNAKEEVKIIWIEN